MHSVNAGNLIREVGRNCAVTDARYAQIFSVCGLAMRLRSLYKWRKEIHPWEEEDPKRLLRWIEKTENNWSELEHEAFLPIHVNGRGFDPFDVVGINGLLEPSGMIYGAGYAQGMAPTFFLGCLEEARSIHGCAVFILGKELARDLMALPALSQENRIYIRKEILEAFLWDQILFVDRSGKKALRMALKCYNILEEDPVSLRRAFPEIVKDEIETLIFHELGEILDPAVDRPVWREVLAAYPHTLIELFARTLKDMIADTSPFGRLSLITRERRKASLGLFMAFFDGFRKRLYPELLDAYERFLADGNWEGIEGTIRNGYTAAHHQASILCDLFRSGQQKKDLSWAKCEIHRVLIEPLGLR